MKVIKQTLVGFLLISFTLSCSSDDDQTTVQNQPPATFSLIEVTNTANNVSVFPTLNWNAAVDPDGDDVVYDIYLGEDDTASALFLDNLSETQITIDDRLKLFTKYYWRVVAKDGNGGEASSDIFNFTTRNLNSGTLVNTSGFPNIFLHSSVVFDDKLWVIGGRLESSTSDFNFNEQVLNSSDGTNWNAVTSNPGFPNRFSHTSVVFDEKIWIIGGRGQANDGNRNDVWSSNDGINWTEVTTSANFSPRNGHTSVVFDNKMWVIGGFNNNTKDMNDVWYSSDGENWIEATPSADFPVRQFSSSIVFDNKMWIIGGSSNNVFKNDVWYSSDGINWVETTTNGSFQERGFHTSTTYDDKLLIFGGLGSDEILNDIWLSKNGIDWELATSNSNMSKTFAQSSSVFLDKVFVLGGIKSGSDSSNEVWVFD